MLRISRPQMHASLDAAGILSIPLAGACRIVRRDEIARLGPEWALDGSGRKTETDFWLAVRRYLETSGSLNRLVGGHGGVGQLRSGECKFATIVTFCATTSTVVVSLGTERARSPIRYARLLERLYRIREAWPTVRVDMDESAGRVNLSESFRLGSNSQSDKATTEIARALDERTTLIRWLLRETLPERAIQLA